MTVNEVQELLEAWAHKHPTQNRSELINLAILTEDLGELARIIATKYSEPNHNPAATKRALARELSDIMWTITLMANQADIDLTSSFIDNLGERNERL